MAPVILEEASNGLIPEWNGSKLKAVRTSQTFMLAFTGKDYQQMQHLAQGYGGGIRELVKNVLEDYLRPEPIHEGISPEALAHQDDELTGRLPL